MKADLVNGYRVEEISRQVYDDFRKINEPIIFPNRFDINIRQAYSQDEREAIEKLSKNFSISYSMRLGFFKGDEMVGWSYGMQFDDDTYRMGTTGILPEHQRKGIYSSFLKVLADKLKKDGFQIIFSRHYATDNQVIIPKLKFGFLISGLQLTDQFGLLVMLSYYFNETQRKAVHARSGYMQLSEDVQKCIRNYR